MKNFHWSSIFAFYTFMAFNAHAGDEGIPFGESHGWQGFMRPHEEGGLECIASHSSNDTRHFIVLDVERGDWSWIISIDRPDLVDHLTTNGDQLGFKLDGETLFSVPAQATQSLVIASKLPKDMIEKLYSVNDLRLFLSGSEFDNLNPLNAWAAFEMIEGCSQLGEITANLFKSLFRAKTFLITGRLHELPPYLLQDIEKQLSEKHENLSGNDKLEKLLIAEGHEDIGSIYSLLGQNQVAISHFRNALLTRKEYFAPSHSEVLSITVSLARLYAALGNYSESYSMYSKALEESENSALESEHAIKAEILQGLAELDTSRGFLGSAETLLERARNAYGEHKEPNIAAMIHNRLLLAEVQVRQARFDEAQSNLDLAFWALENAKWSTEGEYLISLAEFSNSMASLYESQGRYLEEFEVLQVASDALDQAGLPSVNSALNFNRLSLGNVLMNLGRFTEAESVTKKVIASAGDDNQIIAIAYSQLGWLYQLWGRYSESEYSVKRSLSINEQMPVMNMDLIFKNLITLAGLMYNNNRLPEARDLLQRAIDLFENSGRQDVSWQASIYINLAAISASDARLDEAERILLNALRLAHSILDPKHSSVADINFALGELFVVQGKYDKAESIFKAHLDGLINKVGEDHRDVAFVYYRLGDLYLRESDFGAAEIFLNQSLSIDEKVSGPYAQSLTWSLFGLAKAYENLGRIEPAKSSFRRGLSIMSDWLGSESPSLDSGRHNEERNDLLWYLSTLSRQGSLDDFDQADVLSTIQVVRGQANGEVVRLLGERLLRGGNSPLAELIRQRQDLTQQVSALEQRLIEAYGLNAGERREVVERLRSRLDGLRTKDLEVSERLQQDFPGYAEFEGSRLTTIAELQTALRPREAALAWVLGEDASYLFIVPSEGDLKLRGLKVTEQEVSSSVDALHKALDLGDPDHLGELAPFPSALAFGLFSKLFGENWKDDLKDIDKLVLVPEGPLTRLAFPALLTEQTGLNELPAFSADYKTAQWLARRFSVSIVPTLSSITVLRSASPEGQAEKPFLGVGDPLLDDHPSKNRGVIDNHEPVEFTTVRNIRGAGDIQPQPANSVDMRRTRLELIRQQPSLPDTAIELQRIAGLLQASNDDLFLREEATEQHVKEATLNQYRLLSFATHGVLAGELGFGIEPGLILTPPEEPTDLDDGFLSMSEIAQLNLNAEWVVLSACNTASAAANSDRWAGGTTPKDVSEGLTGMARAFTYAGARAMLVSHWSVSSATTVALMENIIRSYSQGKLSRSAAHREAMLALIESGDPVKSHPSIWAPFIIFGDG